MDEKLLSLLRRLDITSLRALAGPVILKAIQAVHPANMEREIAEVIIQKFGTAILREKAIRLAIIDTFDEDQAKQLAEKINQSSSNFLQNIKSIHDYFGNSFTERKSRVFVEFLNLSDRYVLIQETDTRKDHFRIDYSTEFSPKLKPYLHDYQKRIKDSIVERLNFDGTRFVVQMPTGAGKTYTALEAVADVLRLPKQNKFTVWIVDSPELTEQTLVSFDQLWRLKGDRPIDVFRFFSKFEPQFTSFPSGGIVFTSFDKFHSVLENPNHRFRNELIHLINNTSLLIVDEAHTSVADTHLRCIRAFIHTDNTDIVGLTATPGRATQESTDELVSLYSNSILEITGDNGERIPNPITFLRQREYLAHTKTELLETNTCIQGNDEKAILEALAQDDQRNKRIIEQIELANNAQESTVVFACTLDHVFALQILCKHKGIHSEFIVGQVDQATRLKVIEDFKHKKFFILINLELLSTGIDVPTLNKIIIARPVGSPILYSQIIGRALRGPKNGGNSSNTIVNLKDNLQNYPSADFLYGYFDEDWQRI